MITPFSSQAGLASFRPSGGPVKVYAAVIEWPEPYSDLNTTLILRRSEDARDRAIDEAIADMRELLGEDIEPFISLYDETV